MSNNPIPVDSAASKANSWWRFRRWVHRNRSAFHVVAGIFALAFSRPTDLGNAIALVIVLIGMFLRIWANSCIRKNVELCTVGPYSIVRHPLYLGNFVIMIGVCIAANSLLVIIAGCAFMALVYAIVIPDEEEELRRLFGRAYENYARRVPAFLPNPLRIGAWSFSVGAVNWRRAARDVFLISLLVAMFELKEDVLERVYRVEYEPIWVALGIKTVGHLLP